MEIRERMRIIELNFLAELFVLCGYDTSREYSTYKIGKGCGCSMNETKQITEKLSSLDLVQNKRGIDKVSITQKGIDLMKGERAVEYSISTW